MAQSEIASDEEIVSIVMYDNSAIAKECCDKLATKITATLKQLGRLAPVTPTKDQDNVATDNMIDVMSLPLSPPFKRRDPTDEGFRRYPPDGKYDGKACICLPMCKVTCMGQCGCDACSAAYSDYLSVDFE